TNPSVLVDKTKSARDGLKTAHTETCANLETIKAEKDVSFGDDEFNTFSDLSSFDDTKTEIKLEDLSKLVQNVDIDFMGLDSLKDDEPIIVQDDSDEEIHAEKLTELLVKSLQPELSKLLSSHDFSSSLPTKLKELLSKLNELTREVKELKKHVHDPEIELLEDLKEIPNKLQTFTSTVKSLTTQVAELKTLYLLNKITKALNKFGHVIESASKKTRDTGVPSAGQAGSHPAEGEKNTQHFTISYLPKSFSQPEGELIKKDKGKESMSSKDAEEEKLKGDHVHFTKEQIKEQKRIEESVKANLAKQELEIRKCPITLKVFRKDGTDESFQTLKPIHTRIDYLHKTKAELGIDLDKPLGEHDPLDKLNDLARKKRKHADDIHDLFRSTRKFKSSVQCGDHHAGTVLNEAK
ncbi:hypothetical protein Tco_0920251, partial [Tanacetum coccineum]